jgi:hypothetical protein
MGELTVEFFISLEVHIKFIFVTLFSLQGIFTSRHVCVHACQVNKVSAKLCTPLAETLLATTERLNESTCLKCMKLLVKV